jgi:hypothetical protein
MNKFFGEQMIGQEARQTMSDKYSEGGSDIG